MCKVKKGKQITRMCDVQNLVTASMLRSGQPFSIQSMTTEIKNQCNGAQIPIQTEQIREMVKDTTTTFLRAGYISIHAGYYFAEYPKGMRGYNGSL